jgi:hypothetical protein
MIGMRKESCIRSPLISFIVPFTVKTASLVGTVSRTLEDK